MLLTGGAGAVVFVIASLGGSPGNIGGPHPVPARGEPARVAGLPAHPPPVDAPPVETPRADLPEPEAVEPDASEEQRADEGPEADPGPPGMAELTLELLQYLEAEKERLDVQVTDTAGQPLSNVLVVFREGGAMLYRERTDASGEAQFQPYANEPGPFRVDAIADGYVTASTDRAEPGSDVVLVMKARSYIEGEVKSPSKGKGVVKLFTEYGERSTPIGDDGRFVFADVDEGAVTVQAVVDPYGSDAQSFWVEGDRSHYVKLRIKKRNSIRIIGQINMWPGKGAAWINGHSVPVNASGRYESTLR